MKAQADVRWHDVFFDVDDKVFLKLRPYRKQSLARRPNEKLAQRFYGPYKILEKIGHVAYCLQLPQDAHIHHVFHESQLKPVVGSFPTLPPLPPQLNDCLHMHGEPKAILGVRPYTSLPHNGHEVLIEWKGLPEHDASWERFAFI